MTTLFVLSGTLFLVHVIIMCCFPFIVKEKDPVDGSTKLFLIPEMYNKALYAYKYTWVRDVVIVCQVGLAVLMGLLAYLK